MILTCIYTVQFSVLLNGRLVAIATKQPISCIIVRHCYGALCILLERAREGNYIGVYINDKINCIRKLILCGYKPFQDKINLAKSKLVLIDEASNAQALLDILRCRVSKLPMTYLGLPLSSTSRRKLYEIL